MACRKQQHRKQIEDAEPPSGEFDLTTDPQFLDFIAAQGGCGLDPLSDEALRLQAKYVEQVGDHPLDVLKTLARNMYVKPSDRIAAARALLEYGARKIPAQLELSGRDGAALKLDTAALGKLSAEELDVLEKLLAKAQGA